MSDLRHNPRGGVVTIHHLYRPRDSWPCPSCGGSGQVRHPLWGSSSCPHPTEDCGDCGGAGGHDSADLRADQETEHMIDQARGGMA